MPLNIIEKTVAVLNSDKVTIWHYPGSDKAAKFVFWELPYRKADNGRWFVTYEELITAAYDLIDPIKGDVAAKQPPAAEEPTCP